MTKIEEGFNGTRRSITKKRESVALKAAKTSGH